MVFIVPMIPSTRVLNGGGHGCTGLPLTLTHQRRCGTTALILSLSFALSPLHMPLEVAITPGAYTWVGVVVRVAVRVGVGLGVGVSGSGSGCSGR